MLSKHQEGPIIGASLAANELIALAAAFFLSKPRDTQTQMNKTVISWLSV